VRPAAVAMRAVLAAVAADLPMPPPIPHPGRLGIPRQEGVPADYYRAIGYPVLGPRALRVDRLEGLAAAARRLAREGHFAASPALASLADSPMAALTGMLAALGYRAIVEAGTTTFVPASKRRSRGLATPPTARDRSAL